MINDTATLQELLFILGQNTSLGPSKYVLSHHNSPQPDLPYATLSTRALTPYGMLQNGEIDNAGNREVVGWYRWDVRFSFFGDNSVGLALETLTALNFETIRLLYLQEGFNLLHSGGIERAPYLVDNLWRDSSFFIVSFLISDKNNEFVSFIEHLGVTEGKFLRGQGDPDPIINNFTIN
jgi:hypothetical protein